MPGSTLGDRVFLGEGAVVPARMRLPSDVVAVRRPAGSSMPLPADLSDSWPPRRRSVPTATHFHRHRTENGGPQRGSALRVPGHHAHHRRVGRHVPDRRVTEDVVVGERGLVGAGSRSSATPRTRPGRQRRPDPGERRPAPAARRRLIFDDGATIGPGTMVHGSRIGAGSVVEPGAIVCDGGARRRRVHRARRLGSQATLRISDGMESTARPP